MKARGQRIVALGCCLLWVGGTLVSRAAEVQARLTSADYDPLDFSGYVLDSDATRNPTRGWHGISVWGALEYSVSPGESATGQFRLDYQLWDDLDQLATIYDANGQPGTTFTRELAPVTLPDPIQGNNRSVKEGGSLRPAAPLDSRRRYRIRVELFKLVTSTLPNGVQVSGWASTGQVAFSPARRILHFTNTVSQDAALNVHGAIDSLTLTRDWLVASAPAQDALEVVANVTLHRWDGFDEGVSFAPVNVTLKVTLREAETGQAIPLADDTVTVSLVVNNHTPGNGPGGSGGSPAKQILAEKFRVRPLSQLDPVKGLYELEISLSHVEAPGGSPEADDAATIGARSYLALNGTLRFGPINTTLRSLTGSPIVLAQGPGSLGVKVPVAPAGGEVTGHAGHTFGGGAPLDAQLLPDGTLVYTGTGPVPVNGPAPDLAQRGGLRFRRSNISLSQGGASGDLELRLPTGLGYAGTTFTRLFKGQVTLGGLGLGQDLTPLDAVISLVPPIPVPFVLSDEAWPLLVVCSAAEWEVATGRLEFQPEPGGLSYVRQSAQVRLAAVSDPASRVKPSNDHLFESVGEVLDSPIVVTADGRGRARSTLHADLGPVEFTSHLPREVTIRAARGGELSITNGVVDPDASRLFGVEAVSVPYPRDCPGANCGGNAGAATLELVPPDHTLHLTGDGGLVAEGQLNVSKRLQWGWIQQASLKDYAHQTDPWSGATFAMPGVTLSGNEAAPPSAAWPEHLLLSGVNATDRSAFERPGTAAYAAGLGDYAGLNFRVGTDGRLKARSILGGKPTGDYPLTGRSKYYVRASGVSGIHEAVFGSFPAQATIYGYAFQFGNFGLSFLDGLNRDSRTEGSVKVVAPSDFTQNFKELKFTCLGALADAKVPPDEAGKEKELKYWKADFETLAVRFDRPKSAACNPGVGYLTLGVKAHLPVAGVPLFGRLGFYGADGNSDHTPGNLITLADAALDPPFDSRLRAPAALSFAGPPNETYRLVPVNHAYFNNYDDRDPAVPTGFLNLAGRLQVPFFESLKVHAHTSADKDVAADSAWLRLMGGWPNHGYSVGGKNFFTDNPFDTDNRGYPQGVSLVNYENGTASPADEYLVRAQRRWLEVVDFDYPLKWSGTARSFHSSHQVTNELLVLNVRHRVRYLSAKNAELTFGASYKEVPQVDVANLDFDDFGGAKSVVENVLTIAGREAISAGMKELNDLLSTKAEDQFKTALDNFVDPVVNDLYAGLKADFDPANHKFQTGSDNVIHTWFVNPPFNQRSVEDALKAMVAGGNGAEVNLAMSIDQTLGDVLPALKSVAKLLQEVQGQKVNLAKMAKGLIGAKAASFIGSVVDSNVNALIDKLGGPLNQVGKVLARLEQDIAAKRQQLKPGQAFEKFLTDQLKNRQAELHAAVTAAETRVKARVARLDLSVGNPFTDIPETQLKREIRQEIENAFYGTSLVASMQKTIRQELYDLDAAIREAVDSLFQQVNQLVSDLITPSLAKADNSTQGFSGNLRSIAGAGRIQGYAHINGDSLNLLRLNLHGQLKLPSNLEFDGFLQLKELRSDGSGTLCGKKTGGRVTEVTLGALDVPVKWIASGVNASVQTKFSFDTSGPAPVLLNLGGGVTLKGEIKLETLKITQASMALAFGELENYISAAARVQINKYEGMGGIMFGRICKLEPLLSWDPDVAAILGQPNPTFSGAYAYGEIWFPVSEALLGIPASCVFQVSASTGAGAGFFVEGPTFVGKMALGLSGDALCIASIRGNVKMTGVKNPDGLNLRGAGSLNAKIGWCPFCLKFSKDISMEYKNDSWSVDF